MSLNRQDLLIEANRDLLLEAINLVQSLDDHAYRDPAPGFARHCVGSHMRHVVEFYECFLGGLATSHIDYDARKRDLAVAADRTAAIARLHAVRKELAVEPLLRLDPVLWVRMEDSDDVPGDRYLTSSVARELQVLRSHTIHHYALIAMTLMAHGRTVPSDFGMAPSTLRRLASFSAKAA
jgi:hypothetical protein